MHLETVSRRAEDLASKVGPVETLVALARLEDALEALDHEIEQDPASEVIDLREVRRVMAYVEPLVASAEQRVIDLRSSLEGQ